MPSSSNDHKHDYNQQLLALTQDFDAMKISQLCAFALSIPQLYFCREYLACDEQTAIKQCLQRLDEGLNAASFSLRDLTVLANESDFYDSDEARLRLAPEPH